MGLKGEPQFFETHLYDFKWVKTLSAVLATWNLGILWEDSTKETISWKEVYNVIYSTQQYVLTRSTDKVQFVPYFPIACKNEKRVRDYDNRNRI